MIDLLAPDARRLLLAGRLKEGLALVEEATEDDHITSFFLAQICAFQGQWEKVRELATKLLQEPFVFAPYLGGNDLMQMLALSAIYLDDWNGAREAIEIIRDGLESKLDMSTEANPFAESFNRIESFILAQGKGRPPFGTVSPINYASMSKDEYARLTALAQRTAVSGTPVTFDQLDANRQHSYYLWKALYDEALDEALDLFLAREDGLFIPLAATLHLVQLLIEQDRPEQAWEILLPEILARRPDHKYQIVWLELLWNVKIRPLMTTEHCLQILTSERAGDSETETERTRELKSTIEINYFCRLARCLTPQAIADLEAAVEQKAENLEAHLKLIGAYSRPDAENQARKKSHINWLIQNYPDSPLIEELLPYLFLDKDISQSDFEEFRQNWLNAIEHDPQNSNILLNASLLLGPDDKALALDLLTRAQQLTPENIKIAERLYELNAFEVAQARGENKKQYAREAVKQITLVQSLDRSTEEHHSPLRYLGSQAWFSFESGETDSSVALLQKMELLVEKESFSTAYKCLIAVLRGRLALHRGDSENALQYLMATLAMDPFAHFRQDDPVLTFADELAEGGMLGGVMEFFALFCQQGKEEEIQRLEPFFAALEAGKKPWVPPVRL